MEDLLLAFQEEGKDWTEDRGGMPDVIRDLEVVVRRSFQSDNKFYLNWKWAQSGLLLAA